MCAILQNLSVALYLSGALYAGECALRQAVTIARQENDGNDETLTLNDLGRALAVRGGFEESAQAFMWARTLRIPNSSYPSAFFVYLAMAALWAGASHDAQVFAQQARTSSRQERFERMEVHAERLQGEAALALGDLAKAEEYLSHALVRARAVTLVEEELAALVALSELRRRQGQPEAACELLDEVWEAAERGPYRLIHADAYNVLAQIEREAGHHEAAVTAATNAYRLAWCDGPPFAYHWGLQQARAHMAALGVPEPVLPPFDASRYEPMPEVEIEPQKSKGQTGRKRKPER